MQTIIGTCHFRSAKDAVRYYMPYYDNDELATVAAVEAKLTSAEIKIGPPTEGKALLHLEEGRFFIET